MKRHSIIFRTKEDANRLMKKISSNLIIALLAIFLSIPASVSAENLGIGFTVLPNGDESKVANNNQLWFALKAGESGSRKFRVVSSSKINQNITFSYYKSILEDGVQKASGEESEFSKWFTTNPDSLKLQPNSERDITLTVKVPRDTPDGIYNAYIRVGSSASNPTEIKRKGTYGIVNNDLGFLQSILVVVGQGQDALLDFEIKEISGYLDENGNKHLKVGFVNTGELPLGLGVSVELLSLEFEGLSFGPYQGGSEPIIKNGDEGFADLTVASDLAEGLYKVRVRATQGEIVKNKIFEVTLDFRENQSGLNGLSIILGIFLLLIGTGSVLLGIRRIKTNKDKELTNI